MVPVVEAERTVAFRELFERERVAMVRVATLLVGSPQLAEEIVQDAFAVVYERWDRIDRPGAFLRTCVVNGCRHARRRREVERRRGPELAEVPIDAGGRELLDALSRLPLRQRAVVVLRFYEGMTQEEVAEALDIPVGTVKSALHRALASLRQEIER